MMKYDINIYGGFTGIPKRLEGEVELNENEAIEIKEAVNSDVQKCDNLRDGFTYSVKLSDAEGIYESQFDESNLPKKLRHFIADVQKTN